MTPWSEGQIAAALCRQTFARRCVLLVDRCTWTGHECDVLGVTTDLRVIDVEIKISRADLRADAKKDKWWHRQFAGYGPEERVERDGRLVAIRRPALWDGTALQWPPRVWKHYYALPADIWAPELLDCLPSPASGVLLLTWRRPDYVAVECRRRAIPNRDAQRLTGEQVMDIARLANLRMWDAYGRRDAEIARRTHVAADAGRVAA